MRARGICFGYLHCLVVSFVSGFVVVWQWTAEKHGDKREGIWERKGGAGSGDPKPSKEGVGHCFPSGEKEQTKQVESVEYDNAPEQKSKTKNAKIIKEAAADTDA